MNKRVVIMIVMLLAAGAMALTLLWPPSHLPALAAAALSGYQQVTLRTVAGTPVLAPRPTRLTAAPQAVTYGDGIYFATAHHFRTTAETSDLRALPYPPQTVWCAPVSDGNSHRVVLVAEHADLYTAYWVVHDSVSPSLLKAVGCPEF